MINVSTEGRKFPKCPILPLKLDFNYVPNNNNYKPK